MSTSPAPWSAQHSHIFLESAPPRQPSAPHQNNHRPPIFCNRPWKRKILQRAETVKEGSLFAPLIAAPRFPKVSRARAAPPFSFIRP